jgi:hypothetical protein
MVDEKATEGFLRNLIIGCWMLVIGHWFLVTGCRKKESLAQRRRLLYESLCSY